MTLHQIGSKKLYCLSLSDFELWFSYNQIIVVLSLKSAQSYINSTYYSSTTSRHLGFIKRTYPWKLNDAKEVSGDELEKLVEGMIKL